MNHEQHDKHAGGDEAQAGDIHAAWNAFQLWSGRRDAELFRRSYLGHYRDRDTFGQRLLHDFGVQQRLEQLPEWLRAVVRLDGAAFAADFERAGAFHLYDAPDNGGTYVFDAYCLPGAPKDQGCLTATKGAQYEGNPRSMYETSVDLRRSDSRSPPAARH